jgi:hypothetical protein
MLSSYKLLICIWLSLVLGFFPSQQGSDNRQISMIGHIFLFPSPYCGIFKFNGSVSRRPVKVLQPGTFRSG